MTKYVSSIARVQESWAVPSNSRGGTSLEATLASTVITHRERPARETPRPTGRTAIVLLHSRAGDEHEVLPLLDALDPEGQHLGLFPLGPLESVPEGRHWYVIERAASPEPTTFLPTLEALSAWLDHTLAEHGVEPRQIVLGGFSQGAAMAYALGLGAGRPSPAAILAFSGYLPRVEGFALDLDSRARLPVSIAHGTADSSTTVDWGREARDRLRTAGLAVHYHEEPVGHTITPDGVAQARAVLNEALA
jgi:phospholipase/carboxylesterase